MQELSVQDITAKRKEIWTQTHDKALDDKLVNKTCKYILSSKSIQEQIYKKPSLLIELIFSIVNKSGLLVPFFLNKVQKKIVDTLDAIEDKGYTVNILKGRQQGCTAIISIRTACYIITRNYYDALTVADCNSNAINIFNDKAKRNLEILPEFFYTKNKYDNKQEIVSNKTKSSWRTATATPKMGRSKTLQFLHLSECAYYDCMIDVQASVIEAVSPNGTIVYETTANGYNDFKSQWDKSYSNDHAINLFFEWWQTDEYKIQDYKTVCPKVFDNMEEWLKKRCRWLKDEKKLTLDQIAWYVQKYKEKIDRNKMLQEYPCTAEEAFISTGSCAFNTEQLITRLEAAKLEKPIKRGYFTYSITAITPTEFKITNIEWQDDAGGEITIYEEPTKRVEVFNGKKLVTGLAPYALGGDTAGEGSDYFTAVVVNCMTGYDAATYRKQRVDNDLYANQIYCLAMYFNNAVVGLEINFAYEPTGHLQKLGYTNLYRREVFDSVLNKAELKYGFRTDKYSRQSILTNLKTVFRDCPQYFKSVDLLQEMKTFVNIDGKEQAIQGQHDDMVLAAAIARRVTIQQSSVWIETEEKVQAKREYDSFFGFEDSEDEESEFNEVYGW